MKLLTVLAVAGIVSVSALGVGLAWNYIGQTQSSSESYDVKYLVIELDDTIADSYTDTFKFTSPTYYTDTVIGDSGATMTYRVPAFEKDSVPAKLEVRGVNTTTYTMNVKLETELPEGITLTLQFYASDATTEVGGPITLTYSPSGSGTDVSEDMTCGKVYYCTATLESEGGTFNSAPSSMTFNVRLTAYADTE